eukprot:CAMPEP_0117675102 /NCGR_PEP_ID=MMETSP0804-20121206/15418_1 /TAXON_ID=1074897 /ORGANISM="Tetraselmis astigmatica, Strain CCMP880" /LENGTH=256 /DNA_ID=CAMNT_0005484067 /DNA_START=240 /DNA_END=1007 /DNA_ORIENTATION=-
MRPDENNLGGAMEINDHYVDMARKVANAKSSIAGIRQFRDYSTSTTGFSSRQTVSKPNLADRLSHNRSSRRQTVDYAGDSHVRNIYHLNRRIENMYSTTERKKNVFDTSVHPVHIRRARQNEVCRSVSQWKPQPKDYYYSESSQAYYTADHRPRSAQAANDVDDGGFFQTSSYYGPPAVQDTAPRPTTPILSDKLHADPGSSDYHTFKLAIENEIVDNHITSDKALKRLFRDYLKHNAPEHRATIRRVVEDLKTEW